jgi:hypothetical protein
MIAEPGRKDPYRSSTGHPGSDDDAGLRHSYLKTGINRDIYGRLPLVKRFLTVFAFISPSTPAPPKKSFRRWIVAMNQWSADIEPEHFMKLHAPSLVSCPHKDFSSVGRITRYCTRSRSIDKVFFHWRSNRPCRFPCAPSENPLCKQYPARSSREFIKCSG